MERFFFGHVWGKICPINHLFISRAMTSVAVVGRDCSLRCAKWLSGDVGMGWVEELQGVILTTTALLFSLSMHIVKHA